MRTTKEVKQGQSLFDIAIELTGDVENIFLIAMANNISITDALESKAKIKIIGNEKTKIVNIFNQLHYPATAISATDTIVPQLEGIDYWAIQLDFQVQ